VRGLARLQLEQEPLLRLVREQARLPQEAAQPLRRELALPLRQERELVQPAVARREPELVARAQALQRER